MQEPYEYKTPEMKELAAVVASSVGRLKRRAEIAEGKIFDALVLMEDWDGEQFAQIRDVLDAK